MISSFTFRSLIHFKFLENFKHLENVLGEGNGTPL